MMRDLTKAVVLLAALAAPAALAKGVLVGPESLAEKDRTALAASIAQAKVSHPGAFAQVARLRERMGELDRSRRGRIVPVSPMLKSIGTAALWPMVEMLAFEAAPRGGLNDTAWFSLRLGLVEAVGMIRDARALPVLVAILDAPETELRLVRAAAEAIARLGSDASVAVLLDRAHATTGERQLMVLSGMGDSRRLRTAQFLAATLDKEQDAQRAKTLVRALSDAGNAAAWTAGGGTAPSEGGAVREVSARALVAAFVRFDGEVRDAASNALMVVDAPATPDLVREAKKDAPGLAAELDGLTERFARNPTRPGR